MSKAKQTKGEKPEQAQLDAIRGIAKAPAVSMVEAHTQLGETMEPERWTIGSNETLQDNYAARLESTLRAAQAALVDIEVGSGATRRPTPVFAALDQVAATHTRSMAQKVVDALVEMQREHAQASSHGFAFNDPLPNVSIPIIHHVQYASGHALAQKLLPL
jgi:DNA polymerase/3'-5' exonuclease PolX